MSGRAIGVAAAMGLLLAAAPAAADSGRLADFGLRLTSRSPDTPTGVAVHLRLHRPGDRNAKPSPIRSATIRLPHGVRFDSRAAPQCTASDDQLKLLGSDACPHNTELTVGSFSAMSGFGPPADPFLGDDHVFNGPRQLIEVITVKGGSASPGFDRLKIHGSTLTANPPKAPGGPPEGESAVRSIDFTVPVRTAAGRWLVTTPPSCPASRRWRSSGTFRFADGSSDTVGSSTPCKKRPRLRVKVRPHRVQAGRSTTLRVRVTSHAARCVAGATVRFAGRKLATGPHGRATVTAAFDQPGLRRVRVTHRGCRPATTHFHVVA